MKSNCNYLNIYIFKTLLLTVFFIGSKPTFAQEAPVLTVQNQTEVEKEFYELLEVDVKPDFPGGITAFYNFVGKNYRVPEENNVRGKVVVEFIIEKDGTLSNFKILRDLGNGTGKEALRVLKKSPKWIPGEQHGKKVRVLYSIPISINSN